MSKITRAKRAGDVTQVVEHLSSKCEAQTPGSPSLEGGKQKENKENGEKRK
jgi:hypothetical protein